MILLHVIKDFGDQEEEEEGRRKKKEEKRKRLKVWKLNLKPFLMMFGFGETPNFA